MVLDIRKGHYIVAEYVDKVTNKHCPNHPWQVRFPLLPSHILHLTSLSIRAVRGKFSSSPPLFKPIHSLIIILLKFAESQVAPKAKLPQIIQAVISSLASPESEMTANTLVLVAHGISGDLRRLEEMKISEFFPSLSFSFSASCHFPFLFSFASFPLPLSSSFLFLSSFLLFFSYSLAVLTLIPFTFPL